MEKQENNKYPFSDEYMRFDEKKGRYILTEKALLENAGIDLTIRLNAKASANPQAIVNGFLDRISSLTYRFIDGHTIDTVRRHYIIACAPSARPIMQEAMMAQALYVLTAGDLSLSADKEKRALWFDETARQILFTPLCETGYSLLYCGA